MSKGEQIGSMVAIILASIFLGEPAVDASVGGGVERAQESVSRALQEAQSRDDTPWKMDTRGRYVLGVNGGELSARMCKENGARVVCEHVEFVLAGVTGVSEHAEIKEDESQVTMSGLEVQFRWGRARVKQASFTQGEWGEFKDVKVKNLEIGRE